ncbi:hypothetical protein LX83_005511 [Goodfellowiella coeruleoviolacea]|uniref:Uncharacterized protein n=1 Tax=Goodfellowiella coeruleoviolacea TaxID=334858 RepID=A0AAE3GJD3_9PSEU|nr:hypothetical protein [Goodfellowiella coeruleoviolacea]
MPAPRPGLAVVAALTGLAGCHVLLHRPGTGRLRGVPSRGAVRPRRRRSPQRSGVDELVLRLSAVASVLLIPLALVLSLPASTKSSHRAGSATASARCATGVPRCSTRTGSASSTTAAASPCAACWPRPDAFPRACGLSLASALPGGAGAHRDRHAAGAAAPGWPSSVGWFSRRGSAVPRPPGGDPRFSLSTTTSETQSHARACGQLTAPVDNSWHSGDARWSGRPARGAPDQRGNGGTAPDEPHSPIPPHPPARRKGDRNSNWRKIHATSPPGPNSSTGGETEFRSVREETDQPEHEQPHGQCGEQQPGRVVVVASGTPPPPGVPEEAWAGNTASAGVSALGPGMVVRFVHARSDVPGRHR